MSNGKRNKIKIFDKAKVRIGNGFTSNANLIISCADTIEFGTDNLLGWNISIIDNDGGHNVTKEGQIVNSPKPIKLGDHVWIASECSILKGSSISSCTVIGYKSNVCGLVCDKPHSLIVGNPAKLKSADIDWEH